MESRTTWGRFAFAALGVLSVVWLTWGVISRFPRAWELAVTVGFPWVTVAGELPEAERAVALTP